MDLKTFISKTLTEILAGVSDANDNFTEDVFSLANEDIDRIKFEIRVTVADSGKISIKTEASVKTGFLSGKLGAGAESLQKSENVQSIKFSVVTPKISRTIPKEIE